MPYEFMELIVSIEMVGAAAGRRVVENRRMLCLNIVVSRGELCIFLKSPSDVFLSVRRSNGSDWRETWMLTRPSDITKRR